MFLAPGLCSPGCRTDWDVFSPHELWEAPAEPRTSCWVACFGSWGRPTSRRAPWLMQGPCSGLCELGLFSRENFGHKAKPSQIWDKCEKHIAKGNRLEVSWQGKHLTLCLRSVRDTQKPCVSRVCVHVPAREHDWVCMTGSVCVRGCECVVWLCTCLRGWGERKRERNERALGKAGILIMLKAIWPHGNL